MKLTVLGYVERKRAEKSWDSAAPRAALSSEVKSEMAMVSPSQASHTCNPLAHRLAD